MILVIAFVFVFLSCPTLLCSATYVNTSKPICPQRFSCQDFGPFSYPFYNTTVTRCGLIKVDCTMGNETIQFGGHSYVIVNKYFGSPSVSIQNTTFQKLVDTKSCEALMNNFTSPTPHLFSISIAPLVTLFKCPKHRNYSTDFDAYFDQPDYISYKRCKHHNVYYKHPISTTPVPSDLPHSCEVIQLPGRAERSVSNYTDIFSLLTSQFFISFWSPSCNECRKKDNCLNNENFECLDAKKGVATLCVGAVATLIIILCLKGKLRWRKEATYNENAEIFLKNNEFLAPKRYSYSQVQKITSSFQVKLGQGGFGSVYKGSLSNGNLVAVKIISESKGNGEDFINEVASVSRTSHVNVVTLVGFCLEGRRRALIYEFMPNGSLEKFIYGRSSSNISQLGWEKLHQIAIGIARGLEYLHRGCNTQILHFDIKPHNILLDQDFCPKISDFGLAKRFLEKRSMISMSCVRGTPGYIAPEIVSRSFGHVSHKSDVYSYGMMILEMVGGRRNVETEVDHTSEIYFPHWIYKKVEIEEQLGLDGIVSEEENEMARKMIIVGLWCIQTNPLSRPEITKVLEMLEGGLELLEIPPKPYMYSP
ncbi:putative glycerophosphodiester phosphodiesterase, protein kinase RLK-Pelle-LRK10L-2 family [Helianthus annuus]|uniref:Glycerophosphodiester phosphodiesterase, protein kinase RLK-Pelle-LRK10L-2 family n=1 Tax=Helianthus annuus TaxID=4232 RepID=A0A251RQN9_HELAN|nr:putative glycerophosphodiester phosphodiesterase, protein kinase RLK-Pelle-LRK10L-2 family [Helianthus annuus]KAJ0429255.1 putative glycerophosphodiester phosphodiesterase, protein kinase RLK-Pelle-LRK10L-2 family [Helianthus annuus]KAJ0813278.1 putative glycerophosphodiester phosphodiesterase, protein kinase RLK-Pelle-LRK10L-2 family [Helianthus annuus]